LLVCLSSSVCPALRLDQVPGGRVRLAWPPSEREALVERMSIIQENPWVKDEM